MVLSRYLLPALVAASVMWCGAASVRAQTLPSDFSVDSSLRVGCLVGWQMIEYKEGPDIENRDPPRPSFVYSLGRQRTEFSPRLPVVAGSCEFSALPFLSGRLGGTLSVLERDWSFTQSLWIDAAGQIRETAWDVMPDFKQWEVAGLFHLWTGMGYRFSVVGGYRQDIWLYLGNPSGDQAAHSSLRDEFVSHVPFIALRTAMFFPWWKASFEVLGSPFMTKDLSADLRDGANSVKYTGRLRGAGLIEFSTEGTAVLTSQLRLGLYGRYTYQELGGAVMKINGSNISEHKVRVGESFGEVGGNITLVF